MESQVDSALESPSAWLCPGLPSPRPPQVDFALESLVKSMQWDEETFGLEYDLDLFNIVAVDDFNMGAM